MRKTFDERLADIILVVAFALTCFVTLPLLLLAVVSVIELLGG